MIENFFTDMRRGSECRTRRLKNIRLKKFNHGGIKAEIYNAIDNHKRDGADVSVMMLDLDYFKNVNDTYGHAAGDATLKKFSDIIKGLLPNEKTYFGRWGGEEFVAVTYGKSETETLEKAEELRKAVESGQFPEIDRMTCSIGVTLVKNDDSFDTLFDRVDKALYLSKANGRNKVTLL